MPVWATNLRGRVSIPLAAIGVVIIAILSVGIGSVFIPPLTALQILLSPVLAMPADLPATFVTILFDIRLPRVLLVAITGAALASSGTAYQGLFRNPLADPYLIGVAAGANLGAIIAMALQTINPRLIGALALPVGAFIGALVTVAFVYSLARVGNRIPKTTLILAGVAISYLASALGSFILLSLSQHVMRVLAFLLGGYSVAGWDAVLAVTPFFALGFIVMFIYARPLNLLLLDEEQAQQLGVDVERVKRIVVVAATLVTASAVAFNGLIGFVGLIVPHAARFLVGPDHRRLFPLVALGGAGFLMIADLIARTIVAPQELPLGIVTAIAGAPFFLYLLRRAKRAAFF